MAAEQSPPPLWPQLKSTSKKEDLERVLIELGKITQTLRPMSRIVTWAALWSLGAFILSTWVRFFWVWSTDSYPIVLQFTMIFAIMAPLGGLMCLFLWERKVGQGMILYEEISDEVEWRHRTFRRKLVSLTGGDPDQSEDDASGDAQKSSGRPNIEVRILLREFLRETTLPFVNASVGTTVYAAFFVVFIVLITGILVFPFNR
jgi:hypothetical protein